MKKILFDAFDSRIQLPPLFFSNYRIGAKIVDWSYAWSSSEEDILKRILYQSGERKFKYFSSNLSQKNSATLSEKSFFLSLIHVQKLIEPS